MYSVDLDAHYVDVRTAAKHHSSSVEKSKQRDMAAAARVASPPPPPPASEETVTRKAFLDHFRKVAAERGSEVTFSVPASSSVRQDLVS
eukprot:7419583-Alexandrium_andersonii.AAC.1